MKTVIAMALLVASCATPGETCEEREARREKRELERAERAMRREVERSAEERLQRIETRIAKLERVDKSPGSLTPESQLTYPYRNDVWPPESFVDPMTIPSASSYGWCIRNDGDAISWHPCDPPDGGR